MNQPPQGPYGAPSAPVWRVSVNGGWQPAESEAQIAYWVREGHLGPHTLVQHATWPNPVPLAQVPNFAGMFAVPSVATGQAYGPPPQSSGPPHSGYGAPLGPPASGYGPGLANPVQGQAPKRGMGLGSFLLIILGCAMVLGVLVALGQINRTRTTPPIVPSRTTAAPVEVTTPASPPIHASIKDLLSEYKANEVRADEEYKGATVQLTGQVNRIAKDITGRMYVTMGTGKRFEIPEVQCMLTAENQSAASSLSKGQTITVHGEVKGL